MDYDIYGVNGNGGRLPKDSLSLEYSGTDYTTISWTPTIEDTGRWKLTVYCWDYYMDIDSFVSILNVISTTGINTDEKIPLKFKLSRMHPTYLMP